MSRRRTLFLAAAALVAALSAAFWTTNEPEPAEPPPSESLSLRVDISERTLYARVNGETRTYGVGVGTSRHPTPRGGFAITRVIWNPRWVPPDSE